MSAYDFGSRAGQLVNCLALGRPPIDDWYLARSFFRWLIGWLGCTPLAMCVMAWRDGELDGNDATAWMVGAAVAVLVFVLVMRWLGYGRGPLWGFWLSFLSYWFWNGLLTIGMAGYDVVTWQKNGLPANWPGTAVAAFIGLIVVILCRAGLRSAEARGW